MPEYADGKLIRPVSTPITIVAGADSYQSFNVLSPVAVELRPVNSSPTKSASGTEVVIRIAGSVSQRFVLPESLHIWSAQNQHRTVNIRMSVYNGTLSLQIKFSDETAFNTLSTQLAGTPIGNVQIVGMGMTKASAEYLHSTSIEQANFSVDNLSIVNRDRGAKLVVLTEVGIIDNKPDDYDYTDNWSNDDLLFYGK